MVLSYAGDFLNYIPTVSSFRIETVLPYSEGILIAGAHGLVFCYKKVMDEQEPFVLHQSDLAWSQADHNTSQIQNYGFESFNSIALTEEEDQLYLVNSQNQLLKLEVNLESNKVDENNRL